MTKQAFSLELKAEQAHNECLLFLLLPRTELPNSLTDFLYFKKVLKVGQKIWHGQNNLCLNELCLFV
jgi:hypothetical protein